MLELNQGFLSLLFSIILKFTNNNPWSIIQFQALKFSGKNYAEVSSVLMQDKYFLKKQMMNPEAINNQDILLNSFKKHQDDKLSLLALYSLQLQCSQCQQLIEKPNCQQLHLHYEFCAASQSKASTKKIGIEENNHQKEELTKSIFVEQIDNTIESLEKQNCFQSQDRNTYKHNQIEEEISQILQDGNLSNGSAKQYVGSLRKFYVWLRNHKNCDPTSKDIVTYLKNQKSSIKILSALKRLKKQKKIFFSAEQQCFMQHTQEMLKERVVRSPNRAWNLSIIQRFINDLIQHKFRVLAYRILMLFELGARVGELSQITFKMILSGKINYIPQKQAKRAENARRILILTDDIVRITQEFMSLQQVTDQNLTLNIGNFNKPVKYNALQKALKIAILYIQKQLSENSDYSDFLKNFSYHDLRHSKLQNLKYQGVSINRIQEFVKHSNQQLTEKYMNQSQAVAMGINGEIFCLEEEQQKKLTLSFEEGQNEKIN